MSGAGDRVIFSVMECSGSRQRWLHTSENTLPVSEQSTLPGCQCRENPRSTRTATEPRQAVATAGRDSGQRRPPLRPGLVPRSLRAGPRPHETRQRPPHLLAASLLLALVSLLWLLVLLLQGSDSGARPWLFLQEAQWWGFGGHLGLGRSVPCLCAGTPAERRAPGLRQHATCRVSKQEVQVASREGRRPGLGPPSPNCRAESPERPGPPTSVSRLFTAAPWLCHEGQMLSCYLGKTWGTGAGPNLTHLCEGPPDTLPHPRPGWPGRSDGLRRGRAAVGSTRERPRTPHGGSCVQLRTVWGWHRAPAHRLLPWTGLGRRQAVAWWTARNLSLHSETRQTGLQPKQQEGPERAQGEPMGYSSSPGPRGRTRSGPGSTEGGGQGPAPSSRTGAPSVGLTLCSFSFFLSRSFSLCFFSFFLGFLLFFPTTGMSSFSGDLEVSVFLCFWIGSFSLSAKGLHRNGEEGGQVTEGAPCQPTGSRSVLPHVTLLLTGPPVRDPATQHMHGPKGEPSATHFLCTLCKKRRTERHGEDADTPGDPGLSPAPHSLIQVYVQGPVRVVGVFVILITRQSVLRKDRDLGSRSPSLLRTPAQAQRDPNRDGHPGPHLHPRRPVRASRGHEKVDA